MRIKAVFLVFVALGLVGCKKEVVPQEPPRPAPIISSAVVDRALVDKSQAARALRMIPPGSTIQIRNNEPISLQSAAPGQTFQGSVERDVLDNRSLVVFPRGSEATLVALDNRTLDIGAVTVKGRKYGLEGAKQGDASAKVTQIASGTVLSFQLTSPISIREIQ
jgi:hypothetical protein